jgi:hypothetical protein
MAAGESRARFPSGPAAMGGAMWKGEIGLVAAAMEFSERLAEGG